MTQDDLAHLSGFTADGPVLMSCDRCGEGEAFGPRGEDVPVSDLAAWARDHICLEETATATAQSRRGAAAAATDLSALGAASQ